LHRIRAAMAVLSMGICFKNFKKKKTHGLLLLFSLVYLFATGRLAATCRPLNICLLPVGYAGTLWYTAVVHGQTGRRYKCFTFECHRV
jgi:hypothetical protein